MNKTIRFYAACVASIPLSAIAADLKSPPSPEQISTLEVVRQDQRLHELKQQLLEQNIQLTPKPAKDHQSLQSIVVAESPCFKINQLSLDITNNQDQRYSPKDFDFVIKALSDPKKGILGQCIGTQSLQNLVKFAQNEVLKKGYLTTQVIAPQQDLNTGILELQLELGRLHQFIQKDAEPSKLELSAALPFKENDVLNLRQFDQGLENLKRATNRRLDLQIVPTNDEHHEHRGYSDVLISAEPLQKLNFNIGLDDSGTKSTGKYIGNVGIGVNSPFHLNDAFNLNFSHSLDNLHRDRNQNFFASYQLPFRNYDVSVSFNQSEYEQYVAGYNQPILYSGKNQQSNLTVSRLLSRGSHYKTSVYSKIYHKRSQNFIDDIEVGVQRRQTSGWNAGLQHRQYVGAGTVDVGLDYRHGTGAFNAKLAAEEQIRDINGEQRPAEGYSRAPLWSADLRLNYPLLILDHPAQYRLNWKGQYAPKILVPQDRFYIGGRYSVRGFDGDVMLSGDNGHYLQQEMSFGTAIPNTQFYLGIDQGWVNGRNSIAGKRHLIGSVFGLRSYSRGVYLDAFAGHGLVAPKTLAKDWVTGFSLSYSY
ncbi:ShlB/FhaC/HecB family hemolysin secretion/activation protein [Acinetobacter suaedae]|uniref:ShlB/FhaC/HecB family hemolysin secretion/activation protein n=1 Tax=Acinetobacter suaedae TaxID=2609668 RepID=A0A5P1UU85_9GAMM|nr:ShlB/FhaC/HecB family hemolysin secretion/activation protein [Acinetobacter sp. C16S1]QER40174.1 ShlB/FhaC/HecB family hemolysin secretion/activation protein [Acinetobacter sp. C16S1]